MLVLAMVTEQTWAAGAHGAIKSTLAPLEAAMTQLAGNVDRVSSVFGDVSALRAENQRLTAADQALRRQVVELNAAAKENATLRQALDFERSYGHRMVASQIVGRGPDGFSRTLEIDSGTAGPGYAGDEGQRHRPLRLQLDPGHQAHDGIEHRPDSAAECSLYPRSQAFQSRNAISDEDCSATQGVNDPSVNFEPAPGGGAQN